MRLLLCLPFCVLAATPLTTVHPSWTKINLRQVAGFQPLVGGMDFLSDGRLVVGNWAGTRALCCPSGNFGGRQYSGKVYIMSGVTGDNPNIVIDTFATGLEDIMGLTVVRDTIYVSGGNNIIRLVDTNNDGKADRKDTLFTLPGKPQVSSISTTAPGPDPYGDSLHPVKGRSEWLYGLLARSDTFFVNPSSMYNASDISQVNPFRGTSLAVTAGNGIRGKYQIRAMGLRHPTGLTFGPEGTIWTCETQGHWVPTDKLIQIKTGAFYGFHHTPAETWDNMTETPAAVFLPEEGTGGSGNKDATGVFADSPGQPYFLTSGPYAGQFIMGDVSWGGVQRFSVEKLNGDYQGAGFVFTGGLESGVYRIVQGPDGMLYFGMVGAASDWSWNGQFYGLQKIKYGGTKVSPGAITLLIGTIQISPDRKTLLNQLHWKISGGHLILQTPFKGTYQIRIRDVRGVVLASAMGAGPQTHSMDLHGMHGYVTVEAIGEGVHLRRTLMIP